MNWKRLSIYLAISCTVFFIYRHFVIQGHAEKPFLLPPPRPHQRQRPQEPLAFGMASGGGGSAQRRRPDCGPDLGRAYRLG